MPSKSLIEGFLDYASSLKDPRIERNQAYLAEEILLVALCGAVCGAEGWSDLALFGRSQLEFLRRFLPFANGIPTDDTFRRFFRALDPEKFERCFVLWTQTFARRIKGIVPIDGKTVRGSHDSAGGKKAIHMVSAWAGEQGIALGQVKTDDKSNEITAVPKLLDMLALCAGDVVTADAMSCQKK